MKLFKDSNNTVFAYEADGSQDTLIGNKIAITKAEADQIIADKQANMFTARSYSEKRRSEYPPIGDQLDALWKGGDAAQEMLQTIQAVKAKYPKE